MSLETFINENKHNIFIRGPQPELKNFLYCLDEVLTKGEYREEIDDKMEKLSQEKNYYSQIKFNTIQRMFVEKNGLLFFIGKSDKKSYFSELKNSYQEAKKLYDEKKE